MQKDDVLLRMEGICKSFPGVKALDDAQLTVRPGTVHALMGENGAGKSTLMKCLFGIYSKDAGTIWFDGKEVNFKSSRDALDNGVAMVHQELNQALKRSVMDNIWLGRYPRIKLGGAKMPFVSDKAEYDMTMEVFKDLNFEKFGININPRTIMSTMPVSRRQMVEIAKAVSFNSKIIVLDEPTSSLTEAEVEVLFSIPQDEGNLAHCRRRDRYARRTLDYHPPQDRIRHGRRFLPRRGHSEHVRSRAERSLSAQG